jgi:predicted patatin/cPLA2 family phospholipase
MENKIAIVMSGGGMPCSYGAGAIVALVEKSCLLFNWLPVILYLQADTLN